MKHTWTIASGTIALLAANGCSANDEYVSKLRDAMDRSSVTLADTVRVAETDEQGGPATRAALLVDADPLFSVRAFESGANLRRFHIDLDGNIVTADRVGTGSGPCPGAISLLAALAVAESEAGGVAVASVPDDDVPCAYEVQVLTPDTLWEVKVGPDGMVLESEESDEDGSEDDD